MHLQLSRILSIAAGLAVIASSSAAEVAFQAPRVTDQPIWTFPTEVAGDGIYEGEARVLISVSDEGELLDFIVVGYTHPAFAKEVAEALPRCRFAPGRVRGEPATTRVPLTIYFQQQGTVVSMIGSELLNRHMARFNNRVTYKSAVAQGGSLDRPLQTTFVVPPAYPSELRSRDESGVVTVDFYVDPEGRVRMPATAASSHPSFSRMAISAVEQWKFEPPTSGGEPVLVHVQQEFRFPPPSQHEKAPAERTVSGLSVSPENEGATPSY